MPSEVEMFFAEQDEIMNKPSETIADYLARRRQRSRVSLGYQFSSSPIAISSLKAISFLQGDSWSEPCADSQGICPDSRVSGNVPARNAAEVSQQLPDVVRAQGDTSLEPQAHCTSLDRPIDRPQAAKKRALDDTEIDHGASSRKKSKRNDHLPTPTAASTDRPSRPETTPAASVVAPSSVSPENEKIQHGDRTSLPSHPSALSANEIDARAKISVPGTSTKRAKPPSRTASSTKTDDVCQKQKRPRGVEEKRHIKPRMSSADTSNVTTPPNTAPETARSSKSGKKPVTLPKALVPHAAKATPVGKRLTAAQKRKQTPLYTPSEYAKFIQAKFAEKMKNGTPPIFRALKGKRFFFSGGDYSAAVESTRKKMDMIVKNSGEIIGDYDPQKITHIVTSDDVGSRALLSTIGVGKLSDIPEHIPILRWVWVPDTIEEYRKRLKKNECVGVGEDSIEVYTGTEQKQCYAVFSERLKASKGESSVKQPLKSHRAKDLISDSEDEVDPDEVAPATVSRASSDVLSSSSGAAAATKTEDDPLAEFYLQAQFEQFQEMYIGEDDGSDSDQESTATTTKTKGVDRPQGGPHQKKGQKKGFLCDDKGAHARPDTGFNKLIIDKFIQLRDIHALKGMEGDFFRVRNLNKAIASLRKAGPITNAQQAEDLPGIGKKTMQKIAEILGTGELQRIKWELTEDLIIKRQFAIIHNVGIKRATVWYNRGCRTLEDVIAGKGGIRLSDSQKIGLKYYHELQERIPRSEVQEIYDTILDIALSFDPNLYMRVMGSFRRGKADCGDIDILITRPTNDGKTHRGILPRLLAELHRRGIITDDLTVPKDMDGLEQKYNGICRKDPQSLHRRIDFLTMPWKSRGGALLYFTGDDIFNRSLRLKANKMGYSLNQRGLYAGVIRDPNDRKKKLHEGTLIASETEQEIFRILGVPWQEPHERVRS